MDLDGKSVIVTGASSGIGRAAAVAFARAGARVLGVGRDRDELDRTAEHPGIVPFAADLATPGTPEAVVRAAADRWGGVDVLVNNAGATAVMPLERLDAGAALPKRSPRGSSGWPTPPRPGSPVRCSPWTAVST